MSSEWKSRETLLEKDVFYANIKGCNRYESWKKILSLGYLKNQHFSYGKSIIYLYPTYGYRTWIGKTGTHLWRWYALRGAAQCWRPACPLGVCWLGCRRRRKGTPAPSTSAEQASPLLLGQQRRSCRTHATREECFSCREQEEDSCCGAAARVAGGGLL